MKAMKKCQDRQEFYRNNVENFSVATIYIPSQVHDVCVCVGVCVLARLSKEQVTNLRVKNLGSLNLGQHWTNSGRERTTTQWGILKYK